MSWVGEGTGSARHSLWHGARVTQVRGEGRRREEEGGWKEFRLMWSKKTWGSPVAAGIEIAHRRTLIR